MSFLAQVTPDGTTSTTVTPTDAGVQIDDGERADGNLFHSFGAFSIPTGSEAFFNNANNVANIFSRVTGGNISNIDGLIRANGTANLFLINPAGIVFGENARLQLGGSFYGSTADSIVFSNGEFSAADLANPPLITVNAPIGLGFRDNPGDIINRSQLNTAEETLVTFDNHGNEFSFTGITSITGLKVNPGQNIYLIGGNVLLEKGGITAPEGRVELGGLADTGVVEINSDGTLVFPTDVELADVSLSNDAMVNVTGGGGGFIIVHARNLTLIERSQLWAGIAEGMGSEDAVAGDIVVNATDSVRIIGDADPNNFRFRTESALMNMVGLPSPRRNNSSENSTAIGQNGSINIDTSFLELRDTGRVLSVGYGTGDLKGINVTTQSLNIRNMSGLVSEGHGVGNLGDVDVQAEQVTIERAAFINQVTDTPGTAGDAGDININTGSFDGSNFFIGTDNSSFGEEDNGGNINIEASDYITIDDGTIQTVVKNSFSGDSGNINLKAGNITINKKESGFLGTDYRGQGEGNGGDINLEAQNLLDIDGIVFLLEVAANTKGDAGNLNFKATDINFDNNSFIIASTSGQGNAGTINLTAESNLNIDNESRILSQVKNGAVGKAGDININAGSLFLINSSSISASTRTESFNNAGNIEIVADNLQIADGAVIDALTENAHNAGNIIINAKNLELLRGAKIINSTNNIGNAGNIIINTETANINGINPFLDSTFDENIIQDLSSKTGIFVNASDTAIGNAGNITFSAYESLNISNNGQINLDNQGSGNGGNLTVTGNTLNLDQGIISAITFSGEQGNINLNVAEAIRLENNSLISAEAFNESNGGNITIDTDFIIAFPNQNSDIVASAEQGNGGNIEITVESLLGIEERNLTPTTNDINASSKVDGLDGTVTIETPDNNPLRETTELSDNIVSPGIVTANTCEVSATEEVTNTLVVRGRGGITPKPTEPFIADSLIDSNESTAENITNPHYTSSLIQPVAYKDNGEPIYLARGVIKQADGSIILTAYPTENNTSRTPGNYYGCS